MEDIQEHEFYRNVTSVEPNIYGHDRDVQTGGFGLRDHRLETEVVELYTNKEYVALSKEDVEALCVHFGIKI